MHEFIIKLSYETWNSIFIAIMLITYYSPD
jgi:hypothetical protein